MACFVTKTTSVSYIHDSKCHINKLDSSGTCLICYSDLISHEWFLIAWRDIHTHTYTHSNIPTFQTKILNSKHSKTFLSRKFYHNNSNKIGNFGSKNKITKLVSLYTLMLL